MHMLPQEAQAAPRLLIVGEDRDTVAELYPELRRQGIDVALALAPEDGLARAGEFRPDLVLADLADAAAAAAFCARLRASPLTAALPLILLAPAPSLEARLAAFTAGAVDVVAKPCAAAEVAARVLVHVRHKRRLDCLESIAAGSALERVGELVNAEDKLFARATRRLQERLTNPPALTELIRELGVSERKLTELFRQRLGMTVFDYFAELRLETARHLLAGSKLRIQVIADRIGYNNAGDFARAFRRRYGSSPREYRYALNGMADSGEAAASSVSEWENWAGAAPADSRQDLTDAIH